MPRAKDRAAFYHLSFQESSPPQSLARTADESSRFSVSAATVPEWRATLMFLFAGKIASRDAAWGSDLLGGIVADQERAAVKANPAPAVFIAEALDLCLAKKYSVSEAVEGRLHPARLDAIEDEVAHQGRQALGLCPASWGIAHPGFA